MSDDYDLFVSYSRADNREGWIERFLDALIEEHREFTGGRALTYFFDRQDIRNFSHWETEIFNKGLTKARLFLAFLSPRYFASDVCRKEWKAWIDQEIARHILSSGAAPIYIVEVPGFVSRPILPELEVARRVAELCGVPAPHDRFTNDLAPIVKEFRRRQLSAVQPFYHAGLEALRQADLRKELRRLAEDLDRRTQEAARVDQSYSTVPAYNRKFSGRLDELVELRRKLTDNHAGVISGIHGLGGIGKTELAFTFAHAYAGVYPGGRFYIPCERQTQLTDALLHLGSDGQFRSRISDEERKIPADHFAAVLRCLRERLDQIGPVLLVLDNVTDPDLVSDQQTDALTVLGPQLHLLATTRLASAAHPSWLMLGELKPEDALDLMEKYRPFADDPERVAAQAIIRKLGGFALAIELVAAGLAVKPSATYTSVGAGIGLEDLDVLAEDRDVELRRHNHEKRLQAVLGPTLAELRPEERRAMEYAALLPPDLVPLPWLRALLVEDFPALREVGRWGDPWEALCLRLVRLGLLTPVEEETTARRLVRVHRLVQELLRRELPGDQLQARQERVHALVRSRDTALQQTSNWQEARWELEPLDALAWLWDESGHPESSLLMNQIGLRWRDVAEWTRAEPLMRRSLAIKEHSFGADHYEVAIRLNNLAAFLHANNRLLEAEPLMARVVAIFERSLGKDHPNVATALNNLAQLLKDTNRLAKAEPLMRRALAIDEHSFGPHHPNVAIRLNNLAVLLQASKRLVKAEPLMRRALAIHEHSFGPDHPKVATDLNNLALLLTETNRLAEAEPLIQRALAIDERSYGADHPDVGRDLNALASLFRSTNRLAEAEPLVRRALVIDERNFGSDHPNVAGDLNNLAMLLKDTNRLAEAEPLMRRVVIIFIQFQLRTGHPHPHLRATRRNYAGLLSAMGRSKEEIQQQFEEVEAEARRGLAES